MFSEHYILDFGVSHSTLSSGKTSRGKTLMDWLLNT